MKPGQTILNIAAAMLLCNCALAQSSPTSHEDLLPGRVLSCATIRDASRPFQDKSQTKEKRSAELWAPFLEHAQSRRSLISERLRSEVGLTLDEFRQLGVGQLTVAAVKVSEGPVSIVAMVDFRSHELMNRIVARLTMALLVSDFNIRRYSVGRTCVSEFRRETRFREVALCIQGSTLCITTDSDVLRKMLCQCDATDTDRQPPRGFSEIVANCRNGSRTPLLTWYVDPIGMFRELVIDTERTESDFRRFLLDLIPQTGLDSLVAIGGTLDFHSPEFAAVSRTQIVMEQPVDGVLGLFRLQPGDLSPPTWISASTTSCKSVYWDLQSFYDGANKLLSILEGEDTLGQYVKRLSTVKNGFHLKRDLLDQLTGRVDFTNRIADGESQQVVAVQVRDSASVAEFLKRATEGRPLFGAKPTTVSQAGHLTVYTQPLGTGQFCITLIDDTLVFAASEIAMTTFANDLNLPLRHTDEYQRVARYFPARCLMQSYDFANEGLRIPYTFLRTNTSPDDTFGIDLSRLPPFEEFRRTLGPAAAYAQQNECGVLVTHFSLFGLGENSAPRIAAAQD